MKPAISALLLQPLAVLCFLLLPFTSRAATGDEHWDIRFGFPGVTNNIIGLAINNGVIYAGGQTPAGTQTNTPLYMWDGEQWSTPATFYGPLNMQILDLAFVGNDLYVAGTFTNVNGVAANGLAQWNGTSWNSVGFSGAAVALSVSGNNLYVGGVFTNPGGVTATNIAYWDGSAWHALGNGLGTSLSSVRALAVNNGVVYAGGIFTNSGSLFVTNLASWNGSTWSSAGGGIPGSAVLSLSFVNGDLYAGGIFTQAGTTPANNIAMWDGANWNVLSTGLGGAAEGIAPLNGSICVAGSFTTAGGVSATNFAVWNGSSWSPAGTGLSNIGYHVIPNGTNVYVTGGFALADGIWSDSIATWDGNQWHPVETSGRTEGTEPYILALANDGTNLYAGGLFSAAGNTTNASYIARFDGTNWYPLGTGIGPPGGTTIVNSLAVSNNNVYAGGSFSFAGGVTAPNIARWDGTNWYALGVGPGGVVASITVRTNGVYAAGAPASGLNYGSPFFEMWNGSYWTNVPNFNPNNTFIGFYISDPNIGMDAIAFLGTNIFIGGHFSISQYDPNVGFNPITNCPDIMRFDGNYCWIMGTGVNSNVEAMTVLGTNLYVAGLFTNAGGVAASHIAEWNGNAWSAVGTGVIGKGTINALTTIGNNLYAGGSFTNIGGVSANYIAKWDGTNWYALGSGMGSPTVYSLNPIGSDLYVGGIFRSAGGKNSYYIAHWNDQTNFNVPNLIDPASLPGGQFKVRLSGVTGQTNIIQGSTNLINWAPVLTNSAGIYDFIDPASPGFPLRFYRAVLGP